MTSSTGQIYSMGCNKYGELGIPDNYKTDVMINEPMQIRLTARIISTSCGLNHTLVLTTEGIVYTFGRNDYGQCGYVVSNDTYIPRMIDSIEEYNIIMINASSYGHGSYCVADNGIGWRFGTFHTHNVTEYSTWPTLLPFPVITIADDDEHVMIDFDLNSRPAFIPKHNHADKDDRYFITAVSAGTSHVLFLTLSGEVWCMGLAQPCLGLGPFMKHHHYIDCVACMLLPSHVIANGISCSADYSFITTTNGQIYYCGGNQHILTPLLTNTYHYSNFALGYRIIARSIDQ